MMYELSLRILICIFIYISRHNLLVKKRVYKVNNCAIILNGLPTGLNVKSFYLQLVQYNPSI